ncbi:MAG: hypothetical protein U1F43_34875 [Myxococcota bacterium]
MTLYRQVFARGAEPGPGPKTERLGGRPVFVVPNPSGLNASFPGFASKLVWFEALARWLDALPSERRRAARVERTADERLRTRSRSQALG